MNVREALLFIDDQVVYKLKVLRFGVFQENNLCSILEATFPVDN